MNIKQMWDCVSFIWLGKEAEPYVSKTTALPGVINGSLNPSNDLEKMCHTLPNMT